MYTIILYIMASSETCRVRPPVNGNFRGQQKGYSRSNNRQEIFFPMGIPLIPKKGPSWVQIGQDSKRHFYFLTFIPMHRGDTFGKRTKRLDPCPTGAPLLPRTHFNRHLLSGSRLDRFSWRFPSVFPVS